MRSVAPPALVVSLLPLLLGCPPGTPRLAPEAVAATGSAQGTAPGSAAPAGDGPGAAELRELAVLMDGHTDRDEEARILALLRAAPPAALDAVVRGVDLPGLLGDVDDRPFGPDNHEVLMALLTRERLGDLSVAARAALVDALMRGDTDDRDERGLRDLLLGTRGADVVALLDAVDAGDDDHDAEHLVFHDLDDGTIQAEVLAHVAREAPATGEVKVLSDIDDTLYRNWVDPRFPSKAVYPGVLALHRELDLGPTGTGRRGDLAFLTARPADRPGIIERQTLETLKGLGVEHAVVLGGDVESLRSDAAIAERKVEGFRRYRLLFPRHGVVFTGDSGQGDAIAGAEMVRLAPEAVKLVLIHDVVATPEADRAAWAAKGCVFIDTYVGGACVAFERGLISAEGLARVVRAAREQLAALAFDDAAAKAARQAEQDRDVARANALLPEALRVR